MFCYRTLGYYYTTCINYITQTLRTSLQSQPADVVTLIKALPDKQSASDPLPTWLLKRSADLLAPFLCQLFNRSLQRGSVPSSFKASCSVLYTAAILEMLQRQQAARLSSQSAERRTASYIIVERYL